MLVLRHATTRWNLQQRRQGWADPALTASGRTAARQWARSTNYQFAVVASSDLRRAVVTAQIIADELAVQLPVEIRRGLREQHQGEWTGLTKSEIKTRWPGRYRGWPRFPAGGESPDAVLDRVVGTLSALACHHAGRKLLVITHNDVIRLLESAAGHPSSPVPPLEGRWLDIPPSEPSAHIADWQFGPMTAGRASPTGASSPAMPGR